MRKHVTKTAITRAAILMGRLGGNANTPAQQRTRALNRNKAGRPRLYRLDRAGNLEKRHGDDWRAVARPYERAARVALLRLLARASA